MSKRGREDGHVSKEDYDLDGGVDRVPVSLAASVSLTNNSFFFFAFAITHLSNLLSCHGLSLLF